MIEKQNNDKDSSCRVSRETKQKLGFLCHAMNITEKALLKEVFDNIFSIACTYKSINLAYEGSVSDSTLLISFSGKNNLVLGSFEISENATRKQADKRLRKELTKKISKKKDLIA